jgi:hypothetical protein
MTCIRYMQNGERMYETRLSDHSLSDHSLSDKMPNGEDRLTAKLSETEHVKGD